MSDDHPICARCGQEITPDQHVEFVGIGEDELAVMPQMPSEEMVLIHADREQCPS